MKKTMLVGFVFAILVVLVGACKHEPDTPVIVPIPFVDAGPYPQATSDIAVPASPVGLPTDDMRATCKSLASAKCPESMPDSRGDDCPNHLARVAAERTTIPFKCAIDAAGNAAIIRDCGTRATLRWRCLIN